MSSIRKLIYASLLALTSLNFAPSLAAQDAHGSFTLKRSVHWQSVDVPAGEYRFSLDSARPFSLLTLTKMDGARAGFVISVPDMEWMDGAGASQLVITTTAGGSYVNAMQLPDFGMTLNFRTPRSRENQMAKAGSPGLASAQ